MQCFSMQENFHSAMMSRDKETLCLNPPPAADLSGCTTWVDVALLALDRTNWRWGPMPECCRASGIPISQGGALRTFRTNRSEVGSSNANLEAWLKSKSSLVIATDGSHLPKEDSCWGGPSALCHS